MTRMALGAVAAVMAVACSGGSSDGSASGGASSGGAPAGGASSGGAPTGGSGGTTVTGGAAGVGGGLAGAGGSAGSSGCVTVTDGSDVVIGSASAGGEHLLRLAATSASHTSWAEAGNEALILEVKVAGVLRGHLVLHHGADGGSYGMALGSVSAGDDVTVRVSTLSASTATRSACVTLEELVPAAGRPDQAGIENAPIIEWPLKKRFDDLPVVLGWSKAKKAYQVLFTNENGGTTAQCGGGASGVQAEIARWGRALDIEGTYTYGTLPTWNRCTGKTDVTAHPVQMDGSHPILYYGDGHNRMFESRGGYGQTCGSGGPEKADGDLDGFNVNNPGNAAAQDAPFVLTLRLAPESLDALGYDKASGRREALADQVAPWTYRLLDSELKRENKIDGSHAFGMQRYLYADIWAADVGGSGDSYCSLPPAGSGFVLRVKAAGSTLSSGRMTADYFGGQNAVKRMVIPLDAVYAKNEFTALVFDAYDNDGIYWLALGDVFVPRPEGDNDATIDLVHAAKTDINVYVDDDSSGCSGGVNVDGPAGPAQCVGTLYQQQL